MNWTEVVLAALSLLGLCGWFTSGRKHRREAESIAADNRAKDMELAKSYVGEFNENVAKPLKNEVKGLRKDVKNLQRAIEMANSCPHADGCPVLSELRRQPDDGDKP